MDGRTHSIWSHPLARAESHDDVDDASVGWPFSVQLSLSSSPQFGRLQWRLRPAAGLQPRATGAALAPTE